MPLEILCGGPSICWLSACLPHDWIRHGSAARGLHETRRHESQKGWRRFLFFEQNHALREFFGVSINGCLPLSRASQRVPFGTGQAVLKNMQQSQITTYAWNSFLEIKTTLAYLQQQNPLNLLKGRDSRHIGYSEAFQAYLDSGDQWHALGRCGKDARNVSTYHRNLFAWFDGFQCMKYLHFLRDHGYPDTPLKKPWYPCARRSVRPHPLAPFKRNFCGFRNVNRPLG